MFYLGIDLHRKQMTVSLRDESGDVRLRRQVSTRWPKLDEFRKQLHEAVSANDQLGDFSVEPFGLSLGNCGIRVENRAIFSVQYHPEASPGPMDSHYLFERFAAAAKTRI